MSIGNVKTSGSKGTNYPWQYAMLKTLTAISTSLGAGTEFESRLVRLIAAPYTLYLEVRLWDIDSGAWSGTPTYYEVGSNVVAIPPGPVEYADEDNALVLTAIKTATETTALETASIDTNTAGILADTAVIETNTTGILADTAAIDTATAAILVKNTEIETTANAIEVLNTAILADTAAIETNTDSLVDVANTPTIIRTSASLAVTLAPAVKSISFYNASATDDAHVNTVDLKPGETINFDAGGNGNYFSGSSFTYDADPDSGGAGDLLIIYVT